jgi:REP element-mobilizing transposase RayT
MSHSYCNLLYHVTFSTKHREPWLSSEMAGKVHAYLGGIIRDAGGIALIVNGIADHVHLLAKLRQDIAVSDVVRDLKARSSGWIHRTFPHYDGFAWQQGYGAFTVSASQVGKVHRYILRQQEHHRRVTFQNEFITLLDAHDVEYDLRYIWD